AGVEDCGNRRAECESSPGAAAGPDARAVGHRPGGVGLSLWPRLRARRGVARWSHTARAHRGDRSSADCGRQRRAGGRSAAGARGPGCPGYGPLADASPARADGGHVWRHLRDRRDRGLAERLPAGALGDVLVRTSVLYVAAPERGRAFVERWRGRTPTFTCVLGHTDTCLVPGLSAAGISEELRPLTPAADAEVVLLGQPRCLPRLPSNPLGAPGPAGITRAALGIAGLEANFLGAGLRVWPETTCRHVSDLPGADITTGQAVRDARELFAAGERIGQTYTRRTAHLVIGESVPAGTTTALALLLALGYN